MPWMSLFTSHHGTIAGAPEPIAVDTPGLRVVAGAAEIREKADEIEMAQESWEAVVGLGSDSEDTRPIVISAPFVHPTTYVLVPSWARGSSDRFHRLLARIRVEDAVDGRLYVINPGMHGLQAMVERIGPPQ